eukprot:gene7823-8020_t
MSDNIRGADLTQPELLKEVIQSLSHSVGGPALRSVVDAHFAQDALLKNPLFTLRGKDSIYHLFHFFQGAFHDKVQIMDIAVHGNKALVKTQHNVLLRPFHMAKYFAPSMVVTLLTVPLVVNAEITTQQTPRGTKITSWVEDVSLYTLIYNIVWGTKFYNFWDWVEMAAGGAIVAADTVISKMWEVLAPVLHPHAQRALQSTDRALQEYLGWNTDIANSAQYYWH